MEENNNFLYKGYFLVVGQYLDLYIGICNELNYTDTKSYRSTLLTNFKKFVDEKLAEPASPVFGEKEKEMNNQVKECFQYKGFTVDIINPTYGMVYEGQCKELGYKSLGHFRKSDLIEEAINVINKKLEEKDKKVDNSQVKILNELDEYVAEDFLLIKVSRKGHYPVYYRVHDQNNGWVYHSEEPPKEIQNLVSKNLYRVDPEFLSNYLIDTPPSVVRFIQTTEIKEVANQLLRFKVKGGKVMNQFPTLCRDVVIKFGFTALFSEKGYKAKTVKDIFNEEFPMPDSILNYLGITNGHTSSLRFYEQ